MVAGIVSTQVPRLIRLIAVATLLMGVSAAATANTAHAGDCLASPNSPAPQGDHWYYLLDWATQRKCWYLRTPGQPAQQAAATPLVFRKSSPANTTQTDDCVAGPNSPAPQGRHWYYRLDWETQHKCWYLHVPGQPAKQAPATTGAVSPLHAADRAPMSVNSGGAGPASSHVKMLGVTSKIAPAIDATGDNVQRDVEASTTPAMAEAPPPQSTSSPTSDQAAAPPAAPVASPNPAPVVAAVQAQEPVAVPINSRADLAPNAAETTLLGGEPSNKAGTPMLIIFPMLALGLVVAGMLTLFVTRDGAVRRVLAIIDPEPDKVDRQRQHEWHGDHGSVDAGLALISALSDHGLVRSEHVPFQIAYEISKRKDKLAQLHQDLDHLLQLPTPA